MTIHIMLAGGAGADYDGNDDVSNSEGTATVKAIVAASVADNAGRLARLLLHAFLSCAPRASARSGASLAPRDIAPLAPFAALSPRLQRLFKPGAILSRAPLTALTQVFTGAIAPCTPPARARALVFAARHMGEWRGTKGGLAVATRAVLLPFVVTALASPGTTRAERSAAVVCARLLAGAAPVGQARRDGDGRITPPEATRTASLCSREVRALARALAAGAQAGSPGLALAEICVPRPCEFTSFCHGESFVCMRNDLSSNDVPFELFLPVTGAAC